MRQYTPQTPEITKYLRDVRMYCMNISKNMHCMNTQQFYQELVELTRGHFNFYVYQDVTGIRYTEPDAESNFFEYDCLLNPSERAMYVNIERSQGITVGTAKYKTFEFTLRNALYQNIGFIAALHGREEDGRLYLTDICTENTTVRLEYNDLRTALYQMKFEMECRPHRSNLHPIETLCIVDGTTKTLQHRPLLDVYYDIRFKDPNDKLQYRELTHNMKEFEYTIRIGKEPQKTKTDLHNTWNQYRYIYV